MNWQIPLVLHIVAAYLAAPILIKIIAGKSSRTRSLVWQYFCTAVLAGLMAVVFKVNLWNTSVLIIAVIGAFNAFATYCQWRAVDISLSKTSLFTSGDDLITIGLGFLILNESKFLTPYLGLGVLIVMAAAIYFSLVSSRSGSTAKANGQSQPRRKLSLGMWILMYSLIWGVAVFSMRYFALQGLPLLSFIIAWYFGSFFGACTVFVLGGKQEAGKALNWKDRGMVSVLAVTILVALMLAYWTKTLAPIIVVQPIYQVAEMICPAIIGLWFFKEIKHLQPRDKLIFLVGLVGGLVIALSFKGGS